MSTVTLRNPHSVLAALSRRPQDVLEVRTARRTPTEAWRDVIQAAQGAGVRVRTEPAVERSPGRSAASDREGGRGGGTEAVVRERPAVDIRDLFDTSPPDCGVWLALDQIQDPHNVGAIFRSAAFFGVRGIVLTKHQSAPVTAVAYDVASGGVEHVPFALVSNLRQALDVAKQAGLWVLGTSEHAARAVTAVDRERNWLLVLGNEEAGLRRLTAESCDELCRIPPRGAIGSLNVSVAAGVLLAALSPPVEAS